MIQYHAAGTDLAHLMMGIFNMHHARHSDHLSVAELDVMNAICRSFKEESADCHGTFTQPAKHSREHFVGKPCFLMALLVRD